MKNRSEGQSTATMEYEDPGPATASSAPPGPARRPGKESAPDFSSVSGGKAKKTAQSKDEWLIDDSTRNLYLSLLSDKEINNRGGQVKPAPRVIAPPCAKELPTAPARKEAEPSPVTIGLDEGAESTTRFILYAAILIGISFLIYKAIAWSGDSASQSMGRRRPVAARSRAESPARSMPAAARGETANSGPQLSMATVTEPSLAVIPEFTLDASQPGQSSTHTLTLYNGTPYELAFEIEARDLVSQAGKPVYLPAGQVDGSIAATLVYSTRSLDVKPMQSASLDITLTMPARTAVRAVVISFQSQGSIPQGAQGSLAASLGSVIAITGSSGASNGSRGDAAVEAGPGSKIAISQWAVDPPCPCPGAGLSPAGEAVAENPPEGIQ